jgi:quinol-cytochrome oxidoreductase complex cytochrome b subunit
MLKINSFFSKTPFKLTKIGNPFLKLLANHIIFYPTPSNINYGWSFGSLAGLFFAFQIITGIFLAMHYTANIDLAFWSVEHIMRDVNNGWLLRYLHSNGASMIFIMLYIHIAKALYFRSYTPGHSRAGLFFSGVIIFLLMMGTAFIGYVLPWGQMSLWGATVITNLITAIPFIGENIAFWIWGGFSVGNPTLNRFFSFHYVLPFIVVGIVFLHLTLLHLRGSTNPIGITSIKDKIDFHPYFFIKDALSFFIGLSLYVLLVFYFPNILGHSDNYIMANPLITPAHIVPEWYLLPFYAILRAIPNKIGGVLAMLASILILFTLPGKDKALTKSPKFRIFHNFFFIVFIFNFLFLGFLGGAPATEPYILLSRISMVLYFLHFLIFIPFLNKIEITLIKNYLKNTK